VVLFHSVYQDLEAWHGDMQSRLRLIPDPSETLKYKPTCTAIQQLQVHQYMYTHSSSSSTAEVNGICVYLCAYVFKVMYIICTCAHMLYMCMYYMLLYLETAASQPILVLQREEVSVV